LWVQRWHHRAGALSLTALLLLGACVTGAPSTRVAARPVGDEAVFSKLPTDFEPVRVGEAELTAALATLLLDMPLKVASSHAHVRPGHELVPGSGGSGGAWQSDLVRSYGQLCERRGTPGDCLTLLENGPHLQADDKRGIALALAVEPALEGLNAEVRAMLSPTQVLATLSITVTAYMALLVTPEPVSKGIAAAFTVFLWGYLGWEFFDLIRAYAQLSEDAARATTFAELREAGERFGRVVGPNSVRILVMVGTAAVGETASLLTKAPKLPGFAQASRSVEASTGLRMVDAATGAERIILSVPEGSIRVVLPANALAMAAGKGRPPGHGGGDSREGKVLSNGSRAFQSFDEFKDFMGPAGKGKQWHHILEQHKGNLKRFGPEALHNTENVIPLNETTHKKISAWYSTKPPGWNKTIREWVSEQSYEAQRDYGLYVLRGFGVTP
jgi:hypothetical protein